MKAAQLFFLFLLSIIILCQAQKVIPKNLEYEMNTEEESETNTEHEKQKYSEQANLKHVPTDNSQTLETVDDSSHPSDSKNELSGEKTESNTETFYEDTMNKDMEKRFKDLMEKAFDLVDENMGNYELDEKMKADIRKDIMSKQSVKDFFPSKPTGKADGVADDVTYTSDDDTIHSITREIEEFLDREHEREALLNDDPVNNVGKLNDPAPVVPERELTEEEKAEQDRNKMLDDLYHEGMSKINSSSGKSAVLQGYQKLQEAAKLGHADSDVEIGFALLTGQYLPLNVAGAAEIFQKQADKGNPKAQAGLGFLYGSGLGVVSSQSKALVYLTFSALGGDTMGRMMSGYRYWAGVGVTKNCETALTYYKKVAEEVASKVSVAGGPMVSRIRLLDEEENPAASSGRVDDDLIQYYQFLADKGDAPAQVTLGQLYYQGGRGFEQNPRKAYEYFLKAAEANNANGQAYLGKMFAEGADTIKQNNQTALKYYKMAADQGNPIGQAGMGLMYMYGKGLAAADYDKALMYFKMSADQGWPEGQLHLGNMYFNGHGVKRDFSRSIQLFNLAAQNGHLLALYNLGRMHSTGVGAVRSCRTAVELYKNVCERGRWAGYFDSAYSLYKSGRVNSALSIYMLLAELGYEVAQSNVAHILDQGSSTLVLNETYARALLHWDRAASQGYSIARIKLGDYYYYGRGTEVDYEVAAGHYKIASADKNAQATFNLGYMHERGLGLKKDIHLAKRHYDQAATNSPDAAVPVTLALIKVGFLYAVEFLQNHQWVSEDNLSRYLPRLSDDWDVYAILILALVLAFVLAFRRHHR